ncbi:MAG TPA: tRNA (guanosine(46)-N7)-methyltransferase TrmB [Alphaproteobacteria bacterium]
MGGDTAIWLEIGFGNGEHLKGQMERHPERMFIGAEPFINGMSAFLNSIRDLPRDNIRVWMDDAMMVVDTMPDQYLSGIYVLNPDPWPKRRHYKRRLISQVNLSKFARVLKPGGMLIMASDVDDLSEWMVTQASNHPAFEWTAEKADDWRVTPLDWIGTRYQDRGEKAGRKQSYLFFRRK